MSDTQYRATQAQQILDNPLFVEARATVEEALKAEILSLPLEATERRNTAVAMYKALEQVIGVFTLVINDYHLEQSEITNADQVRARLAAMNERLRNA